MSDTHSAEPVRVLHVLGRLNPGGVEVWLRHVARHIDRTQYQMDFLVLNKEAGVYDDELRALGSNVIPAGVRHRNPLALTRRIGEVLRHCGPYDIVHSHVYLYSGLVLRAAAKAGVRARIAHSHNALGGLEAKASGLRRAYASTMRSLIKRYATAGLACSNAAAASLYGLSWRQDERWQILKYGVDLSSFRESSGQYGLRAEIGVDSEEVVLGHVGSFTYQKNHRFLIQVFDAVRAKGMNARLLLVGDGPLREEVEADVRTRGLEKHVTFLGLRDDVPALMLGAMDVFVLPSHYEGLGLVLVEAQAAGLPCVYSDSVPDEAVLVSDLMHPVSLEQSSDSWAERVIATVRARRTCTGGQEAFELVSNGPFNIDVSVRGLLDLYTQCRVACS